MGVDREAQGRRRKRREGEEEGGEKAKGEGRRGEGAGEGKKAQVWAQGHRGGADRIKRSRVTGWELRQETPKRETPC